MIAYAICAVCGRPTDLHVYWLRDWKQQGPKIVRSQLCPISEPLCTDCYLWADYWTSPQERIGPLKPYPQAFWGFPPVPEMTNPEFYPLAGPQK